VKIYEDIRLQQDRIINQNKASIIISRTTRSDDGAGGWIETPSTLASQDVRIYFKQSRTLIIDEAGWHSERVTKMLMKWDADAEAENETFLDVFNYGSKDYKIYDIKDIYTQNYIVFKECSIIELT